MKKKNNAVMFVFGICLLLVIGGVFVSAEIQNNQQKQVTVNEVQCGCGCNNQCNGTCRVSTCGCGKKLPN